MYSSTETSSHWTSESPLGFAAGDTNIQRYVGNSPTNYTDPSGLAAAGTFIITYGNGDVREFGPNTSPSVIQSILENNPGSNLTIVEGPQSTIVPDALKPFLPQPQRRPASTACRRPEFWKDKPWSPYDWHKLNRAQRKKAFLDLVRKNKDTFIRAARQHGISPGLLAAILWDELVGSQKGGGVGYDAWDFKDDTNNVWVMEGESYGPFQIGRQTAIDVIDKGFAPKPAEWTKDRRNLQAIEEMLVDFNTAIQIAAGRLEQIIQHWDRPGGFDMRNRSDILGTLYSIGLTGKKGVHGAPTPNERGVAIGSKADELEGSIFGPK